eukprot:9105481-Alexandrium_andersonii.AAC.1
MPIPLPLTPGQPTRNPRADGRAPTQPRPQPAHLQTNALKPTDALRDTVNLLVRDALTLRAS